jgi:arginine decarboxylase
MNEWTKEDALNEYQIHRWSDGYFTINDAGEMAVCPNPKLPNQNFSIATVIEEMKGKNITYPCVIRFHDILRSQISKMNELFNSTMKSANFKGDYFGVYPVKVNQLREVVEEVVDIGSKYKYGLEAGSKSEILVALTYNQNKNSLTVLNGYKDQEFMDLALLGTQLGHNLVVVIEKLSEIHLLINSIRKFKTSPIIGVRAKLSSKSSGKWSESSGENAKFGLSISEILKLINILKEENLLEHLNLFHFHVGSQIPDIRTIKDCITEGARIFVELKKLNVPIKYFDVGGGVGINYDGTRSNCQASTNYTLKDYIGDVVYILRDICNESEIDHPNIVNEAGRVVTAHHSCVVTNVFGHINYLNEKAVNFDINEEDPLLLRNMKALYRDLDVTNYQDIYNDASVIKDEAISGFKLNILNIHQRSLIEDIYFSICHKIINMTKNEKYVPVEIKRLQTQFSDKYLCNFSVFQSTPDSWAINQILPIVPISRLKERPLKRCTLSDITCDSDGKINKFIGPNGNQSSVLLHELKKDEDYQIGIFLTGAYQDVMGDMHNLFGRLNEVHVFMDQDDPNGFYIEEIIYGHNSAEVLSIMQYNPKEMCKKIKNKIDQLVKEGQLKPRIGVELTDSFENSIQSYTYLS